MTRAAITADAAAAAVAMIVVSRDATGMAISIVEVVAGPEVAPVLPTAITGHVMTEIAETVATPAIEATAVRPVTAETAATMAAPILAAP